jgi:hypothetical protein
MSLGSLIATKVINIFTAAHNPVLCVHDSFVALYDQVGRLRFAIEAASRAVVGQPLPIVADYAGVGS